MDGRHIQDRVEREGAGSFLSPGQEDHPHLSPLPSRERKKSSLPLRERGRVRGKLSPSPLSSPIKGEERRDSAVKGEEKVLSPLAGERQSEGAVLSPLAGES